MTSTAPHAAPSKPPGLERRMLFAGLGMACGLMMGLLIWCFDLVTGGHNAVVSITVGLMAIEGMIGFLVAQSDKGKLDDLITFIVAFFIVP